MPVRRLGFVDAAVLGPWNTPFTEHQQRHADACRSMPADIFGELISARFRTATHRPMSPETANAYLAPWAGPDAQRRWTDQVTAVSFEDTREVMERLGEITARPWCSGATRTSGSIPPPARASPRRFPAPPRSPCPGQDTSPREDNSYDTAQALMRFPA
ncbi:hypothetical protein [Streptomyces sp. NPDC055134]